MLQDFPPKCYIFTLWCITMWSTYYQIKNRIIMGVYSHNEIELNNNRAKSIG